MSKESNPAFAEARTQICWYVIGFVLLSVRDKVEHGESGGSGTLVTINGVKGILTCAHVAKALEVHPGEVGIVRFPSSPQQLQKLKLPIRHTRAVRLEGLEWNSAGPDLAFLTLPADIAGSLAATNTFYDLSSRRSNALNKAYPAGKHFCCIAGVVHKLTTDVPVPDNSAKVKRFNALCEPGNISNLCTSDGFDLLDFDAYPHDAGPGPTSYQGVSGAALWRVHCEEDSDGAPTRVTALLLHGVAFYEVKLDGQVPTIKCHGPVSIFGKLLSEVEHVLG